LSSCSERATPTGAVRTGEVALRLGALDGLRAVAVSLVLIHHLGLPKLAAVLTARGHRAAGFLFDTVGTAGVELFFVLSGLVLTRPYLRGGRSFRTGEYARRRMQRLFPPYLAAWLAAGLAVYLVPEAKHPAWIPTFELSDWLKQLGILSFGVHWSWAWWSLSTEVLFYALIPFLVPTFSSLPGKTTALYAVLILTVSGAILVPWIAPGPFRALPGEVSALVTYAPCFAGGLVLSRVDLSRRSARVMMFAGLTFLTAAYLLPAVPRHIGYGLMAVAIVSRALDPASRLSRELGRWELVWLGERSYSLFLIHCPVMLLTFDVVSRLEPSRTIARQLSELLLAAVGSLLASMLMFSFIERRFARGLETAGNFWPWRPRASMPPSAAGA
jgi:peptidoglycan/LPS O-acetylase OafA/YrhL